MDHSIDSRGGKVIDENSVIMVLISIDLPVKLIAKEQGLIVKVYFDIHTGWFGCKLQTSNHKPKPDGVQFVPEASG